MLSILVVMLMDCVGAFYNSSCPIYSQNDSFNATRELISNSCGDDLPLRFRASTDALEGHLEIYKRKVGIPPSTPSMVAYAATRMSGSSQFCKGKRMETLKNFLLLQKTSILVVDLRLESHGFLDDMAVSFWCPKNWDLITNVDEPKELETFEENEFKRLNSINTAIVWNKEKSKEALLSNQVINFKTATTERAVVSGLGLKYTRIFIIDHQRPRDKQVQQLTSLFKSYPDTWMHFHCKAGKGRTTTVMIMRDMFHNAHRVGLRDIFHRNFIFGQTDLSDFSHLGNNNYRLPFARERLEFLHVFYKFCQDNHHNPGLEWKVYLGNLGTSLGSYLMAQTLVGLPRSFPISSFLNSRDHGYLNSIIKTEEGQ